MQLQSDLWIEGPYYVDFNAHGELRIVGPGNHLYCGLPGIGAESFVVDDVRLVNGQLKVVLHFKQATLRLHDPVIRDVRHIRALTEGGMSLGPSFAQLVQEQYEQVAPEEVKVAKGETSGIVFRHFYGKHWYGCRLNLVVTGDITRHDAERVTEFSSNKALVIEIITESSTAITSHPDEIAYQPLDLGNFRNRADFIRHIFNRTTAEITHLLSNRKTSGYSFGTLFPRDWMESATLGAGDFAPHVIDMMFRSSLTNVSAEGQGWHEDVVGEALYRSTEAPGQLDPLSVQPPAQQKPMRSLDDLTGVYPERGINREMRDIEARYILGIPLLSKEFWKRADDVARVKTVASYLVKQATEQKLMVLSDPRRADAGGWRDSERAYGVAERPIADFAINAVFYPAALRVIKTYQRRLGLNIKEIDSLIVKWDDVRSLFRYRTKGGLSVYALALQGVNPRPSQLIYRRYEVTHTDEAYLLLYLEPSEEEVVSFAERLLSSDYFYTASGPTQVGMREPEFTTRLYHGKVIWTKQTGIISAAITRQLGTAKARKFSPQTVAVLRLVIEMLYHSALTSFQTLGEIPELHYDDYGRARFFDDQIDVEVSANKVQLWSAVGARRIIRDYHQHIQGV